MSTAIGEKRLSTKPAEQDARQRARQSKAHPDCRSTTIKSRVTKISLALSSGRDNHPPAATAEMAILIVAVFSSRLSRYIRWVLRDIKSNRLNWSPINQHDLRILTIMGLVEMRDDAPVLTNAGASVIV
jgi:hypothetical protein